MKTSTILSAHSLAIVLVSVFATARTTSAQEILRTWDELHTSGVWIEDLDGDGHRDFVLGNQYHDLPPTWQNPENGRLRIVSGRTGVVLREYFGQPGSYFGRTVHNLGDLDGDGRQEYAAKTLLSETFVYSGADGGLLWRFDRTGAMLSLGDIDGDRREDLLEGTSLQFVVHRATLTQQSVFPIPVTWFALGRRWALLWNKPADGGFHVVISAPGYEQGHGWTGPGKLFFFGGNGTYLGELSAPTGYYDFFGSGLAAVGDLNGDGKDDLVVGAELASRVFCYDGETRALIHELDRPTGVNRWGTDVVLAGDLNGNGYPDVLVHSRSYPFAIDARTREILFQSPVGSFASPGVADWNGDDFPDVLMFGGTAIRLVSGAPRGVHVEGASYRPGGGVAPRIGATGAALPGASVRFHLSRVPPGQVARLVVTVMTPRGRGLLGGRRLGLPRVVAVRDALAAQIRPGEGVATVALQVPGDPALIGSHFSAVWQLFDSAGRRQATTRTLDFEVLAQ